MKKKWVSGMLALLLVGTTVGSMMPTEAVQAEENSQGKTYYVDSENGKDTNDGLSEGKAFQTLNKVNDLTLGAGDRVLLKNGSVFEDQALHIKGSGSENAPIKISTYGDEKDGRPQINTNGHGQWELNYGHKLDNQNHKWHGTVSSSILLKDVEYIEIEGLEITNDRDSATDAEKDKNYKYNDAECMDRTGVAGVAKNKGTVDHIVLNDLYIHDVTGNVYNKHMTNGGIYFIVEKPENESATGIARYNDVTIQNCYLDTVNRWGIAVGYTYEWAKFNGGALSDETMKTYASSDVVIQNNYLNNVGGDAITTMYIDRPVIQYNVSENAAAQINTTDYTDPQPQLDANGNPNGKTHTGGRVAAGIWPWKCKNAVFQYNECFKTLNASKGNGDGQPWDADYGDGTNYQYNYSHGNTASTIMFCGGESINNTFRYNISVHEDMGPLDPAGNAGNTQVYNNTFVIKEGIRSIWYRDSGPVTMENNIFYFDGEQPAQITNWNPRNNKVYSNNLFYNVSSYPDDKAAVKVEKGTPVLADAASGPAKAAEDKQARRHEDPTEITVFDGFKLAENSPAINKGKVVIDRNGYSIDHDFFGHAVTATPEIGAAESDVIGDLVLRSVVYQIDQESKTISDIPKNTTVEQFCKDSIVDTGVTITVKSKDGKPLENADIIKGGMTVTVSCEGKEAVVYTVVASSDNKLKSAYYEVKDKTIYVPFTEKNPTTAGELKGNVQAAETAEVSVVSGEKTLKDQENIADAMTMRITAEDGKTNDYTIKQKNTYNWALDYAGPQQGNVWFGQKKAASGEWTEIKEYDSQYPNWMVNTYYGPGIDEQSHSAKPTEATHGLLSAPPSTGISTAMAYRVPKDGIVSFHVKDDEPYLRQNGNSGGTVTLKLLVNDEEKQSVILEQSKVQAKDWKAFDKIEVKRGDYIRVAAISNGNPTKPSVHVTPIITYLNEGGTPAPEPTPELKAPVDVKVSEVTETSAKVSWKNAADGKEAAGYNVYVDGTKVNEELIAETTYNVSSLKDGTTYSVEVTAVDADGEESAKSEKVEFTTVKKVVVDKEALKANIERASALLHETDKYTEESLKALEEALAAAQKVNSDPKADQTKVNDANKALEKAIKDLKEQEKPDPEPTPELKAPVDVKVSEITETSAKASWKNAADGKEAAGYNVYVDGVKLNKELLTEASCGLTNLKAETTYFVEVTAVDAAGNESVKSEKVTFKTLKAEEQKEDSTPENNEKPGAVQTGDHANVFVWMIGLLISASAAVAVMFKRNKNR